MKRLHATVIVAVALALAAANVGDATSAADRGHAARAAATPAAPCTRASVSVRDDGPAGVAAGQAFRTFRVRSTLRCTLRGNPTVKLLGRHGGPIDVRVTGSGKGSHLLTVAPGRPAYLVFGYTNPDTPTPPCGVLAYGLAITPRGTTAPLRLKLRHPLRFCADSIYIASFDSHRFG